MRGFPMRETGGQFVRVCAMAAVSLAGASCGFRAPPAMVLPLTAEVRVERDLEGLIEIRVLDARGVIRSPRKPGEPGRSSGGMGEGVPAHAPSGYAPQADKDRGRYLAADISGILGNPSLKANHECHPPDSEAQQGRRNKIVSLLLLLSDINADAYFSLVFGIDAVAEGGRNVLGNLLGGGGAATIPFSAPVALGLSVGGLFVSNTVEQAQSQLFQQKTFEALDAVIRTERARVRRAINAKFAIKYQDYNIYSALADVQYYHDIASLRKGASLLSEAAARYFEPRAGLDTVRLPSDVDEPTRRPNTTTAGDATKQ